MREESKFSFRCSKFKERIVFQCPGFIYYVVGSEKAKLARDTY